MVVQVAGRWTLLEARRLEVCRSPENRDDGATAAHSGARCNCRVLGAANRCQQRDSLPWSQLALLLLLADLMAILSPFRFLLPQGLKVLGQLQIKDGLMFLLVLLHHLLLRLCTLTGNLMFWIWVSLLRP